MLVLACPSLDCVDVGRLPVKDVCPDCGDQREQEGGQDCGKREGGA